MNRFNLEDYETVDQRIRAFRDAHPLGWIVTDIVELNERHVVVKATVGISHPVTPEAVSATGHAMEVIGSTPVNKTSALENCETSAVGRALRNLAVTSRGGPSREEMQQVENDDQANNPIVKELEELLMACTTEQELGQVRQRIIDAKLGLKHNTYLRALFNAQQSSIYKGEGRS